MSKEMDDRAYFRHYRGALGFSNQQSAKDYLAGKDITPAIDYGYIDELLARLCDILEAVNDVIHESLRQKDISQFCREHVTVVYQTIQSS